MKKLLTLLASLLVLPMFAFSLQARDVKIVVEPSDARIFIDGQFYGEGVIVVKAPKKNDFISVRAEAPGFEDLNVKIYGSDKRKAISYKMKKDYTSVYTVKTGLVNKFFTVNVAPEFYTVDKDGNVDSEKAWKLIHQILLNYFEEIQTSDMTSGFVQTPWKVYTWPELEKHYRTRVTVKQTSLDENLTFQVKVSAEKGQSYWQETDVISKELEPMISEFQSRLGKQ